MSTTNFTTGTVIESTWLNDVDDIVYRKSAETISVKDPLFGAIGNGIADDTAAIQAAINNSPGKTVYFPSGNYAIHGTINITENGATTLLGAGLNCNITQKTPNVDTFKVAPTTAGVTSAYLNNASISGFNISHTNVAASSTTGAGVRFVQCSPYRLFNATVNNAPEGITVMGGGNGSLKSFNLYAWSGLTPSADTAMLSFRQAPVGAGFQPCYTVRVEDFNISANLLYETGIYIRNCDGLQFSNGYVNFGDYSLCKIKAERDNSYISGVTFNNVYFDCVNASSTPYGIEIPADGFASTYVYSVKIGSGCVIGNGSEIGIISSKPETYLLSVDGTQMLNFGKWAVSIEGSTSSTDAQITNNQFSNVGDGSSGAILIDSAKSLCISANTFSLIDNVVLNLSGTINQALISGNANSSNVPDITNGATLTYGLALSGNASRYAIGANSWKTTNCIYSTANVNFGSIAVGSFDTKTVTVAGVTVGNVVSVNTNGGTPIYNNGTSTFLFVGGVTAPDTVSLRCFNLAGITTDLASIALNFTVSKS